jgi:phosphomannomutase
LFDTAGPQKHAAAMMHPTLVELDALIPALYGSDEIARPDAGRRRDELIAELCRFMWASKAPPETPMKFGTSGWRGLLGSDFTIDNVACVTQGLVDVVLDPAHHAALGVSGADDVRQRGCVLAHDTRLMGPEFVETAARILLAHDIRVMVLGMATTPEVSAAIAETHAAFSINFTPSHNPFQYHGYKFNPADGGPATKELTGPVSARANALLLGSRTVRALDGPAFERTRSDRSRYTELDPIALYRQALARRLPFFDLNRLVSRINASDIDLFVDNGFGATRGKYELLLSGVSPGRLHVVNGDEDYLFGGKSREPSVENFRGLQEAMKSSRARLCVGFMNDGDGDRFVGGGREAVLVMNKYGPLVVRYLSQEHGVQGDVTRSVMTSHMAEAALSRYLPGGMLHETSVGFQYMKEFIPSSVNSWEESDGMSPKGWSRDKDGLLAALLLVDMVLHYDKTPEQILAEAETELGTYVFERRKIAAKRQGDALQAALSARFGGLAAGETLPIGGGARRIARVLTVDGIKVVFDDGAWFGVRASGTEPVCRPYVEVAAPPGATKSEIGEARRDQAAIMDWLCTELLLATA